MSNGEARAAMIQPIRRLAKPFANQMFAATFQGMFKLGENGLVSSRRRTMKVAPKSPRRLQDGVIPYAQKAAFSKLHDKQSERDYRELRIDKVGVRNLRF